MKWVMLFLILSGLIFKWNSKFSGLLSPFVYYSLNIGFFVSKGISDAHAFFCKKEDILEITLKKKYQAILFQSSFVPNCLGSDPHHLHAFQWS